MDSIEQKARELVDRFKGFEYDDGTSIVIHRIHFKAAKQCAIICVDEIISNAENYTEWSLEEFKLTRQYEYWQQVKEKIQSL